MKAIKITFISASTKVNAYKLKCGVRKGVMYRQYMYIYIYSCPLDTRALRNGIVAKALASTSTSLSIIYFAIFSQATMKVCFWRQARRAQRYFRHTYDTLDTNV